MTTPITRFEKWNYQAQCQIFTKLYIHTAKTEWIRGPVFIAFGTSLAVRAVLLTASVGDLTINGFRLTLNPFVMKGIKCLHQSKSIRIFDVCGSLVFPFYYLLYKSS
jgi:hypothetical protein